MFNRSPHALWQVLLAPCQYITVLPTFQRVELRLIPSEYKMLIRAYICLLFIYCMKFKIDFLSLFCYLGYRWGLKFEFGGSKCSNLLHFPFTFLSFTVISLPVSEIQSLFLYFDTGITDYGPACCQILPS